MLVFVVVVIVVAVVVVVVVDVVVFVVVVCSSTAQTLSSVFTLPNARVCLFLSLSNLFLYVHNKLS